MKLDLHVHTSRSDDSINSPDWIAQMARRRHLDGLAVTDHNTIKAWKPMKEAARRFGLELVLGEEIKVLQSERKSGEILALFLNEAINPGTAEDVLDAIRQQDGVAIAAHPFDRIKGFRNLEALVGKMDAIEGFNARLLSPAANKMAQLFAGQKGLGVTGGSDSHLPFEVGMGFTSADCSDLEDFRKALKNGKTTCSGRMISLPINLSGKGLLSLKKVCCRL